MNSSRTENAADAVPEEEHPPVQLKMVPFGPAKYLIVAR